MGGVKGGVFSCMLQVRDAATRTSLVVVTSCRDEQPRPNLGHLPQSGRAVVAGWRLHVTVAWWVRGWGPVRTWHSPPLLMPCGALAHVAPPSSEYSIVQGPCIGTTSRPAHRGGQGEV